MVEPAISAAYNGPGKWQIDQIPPDEIWSGATCPLPYERDFACAIWAQFEQAVEEGNVGNVDQLLGWAILAERLLDSLVTSVRGPDYPSRDVQRSTHRAAWLMQHGLSISASYDGVLGFLLGLKLNAHLRSAASCLRMIIREEERQESLLSYFPLQKLHDRLLAATPETQVPAASGALARELHPVGYVSLEKAEALIGCQPGLLYFLVREGFFRLVVTRKPGKKRYVFIHRAEVEDCRRWFSMSLSCSDVQSYLQIDRRGYWVLLDSQLLRPVSLGGWSWHRRQDISTLLCRFDEVSKPLTDSAATLQPFMGEWMHRRGRARTTLIQVIHEILRGELPLYRKANETGLQAYFVDTATPERLRWLASAHQMQTTREARHIGQLTLLEPADV
ncbi:hypothetical protein [Chromobacterium haemolyticum]|uniref:hypothetical protein n=1 Tax=Chromobacterium TaxID=535 RepID=UPI004055ACFD